MTNPVPDLQPLLHPQNTITMPQPTQEALNPAYSTPPEPLEALSPEPIKRRQQSISSKISRYSRNFTDKVANFNQKNPMITMVIIAIIVALLAPQLIPLLL